jgi:hypothetical protein
VYLLPSRSGTCWRTVAVAVNSFCVGIFFAGTLPIWIRRQSTSSSSKT